MDSKNNSQLSPSSSRSGVIGSALTAVKNYFTPERNAKSNLHTGVTPLIRDLAALTLKDSSLDSNDSFRASVDDSYMSVCSNLRDQLDNEKSSSLIAEPSSTSKTRTTILISSNDEVYHLGEDVESGYVDVTIADDARLNGDIFVTSNGLLFKAGGYTEAESYLPINVTDQKTNNVKNRLVQHVEFPNLEESTLSDNLTEIITIKPQTVGNIVSTDESHDILDSSLSLTLNKTKEITTYPTKPVDTEMGALNLRNAMLSESMAVTNIMPLIVECNTIDSIVLQNALYEKNNTQTHGKTINMIEKDGISYTSQLLEDILTAATAEDKANAKMQSGFICTLNTGSTEAIVENRSELMDPIAELTPLLQGVNNIESTSTAVDEYANVELDNTRSKAENTPQLLEDKISFCPSDGEIQQAIKTEFVYSVISTADNYEKQLVSDDKEIGANVLEDAVSSVEDKIYQAIEIKSTQTFSLLTSVDDNECTESPVGLSSVDGNECTEGPVGLNSKDEAFGTLILLEDSASIMLAEVDPSMAAACENNEHVFEKKSGIAPGTIQDNLPSPKSVTGLEIKGESVNSAIKMSEKDPQLLKEVAVKNNAKFVEDDGGSTIDGLCQLLKGIALPSSVPKENVNPLLNASNDNYNSTGSDGSQVAEDVSAFISEENELQEINKPEFCLLAKGVCNNSLTKIENNEKRLPGDTVLLDNAPFRAVEYIKKPVTVSKMSSEFSSLRAIEENNDLEKKIKNKEITDITLEVPLVTPEKVVENYAMVHLENETETSVGNTALLNISMISVKINPVDICSPRAVETSNNTQVELENKDTVLADGAINFDNILLKTIENEVQQVIVSKSADEMPPMTGAKVGNDATVKLESKKTPVATVLALGSHGASISEENKLQQVNEAKGSGICSPTVLGDIYNTKVELENKDTVLVDGAIKLDNVSITPIEDEVQEAIVPTSVDEIPPTTGADGSNNAIVELESKKTPLATVTVLDCRGAIISAENDLQLLEPRAAGDCKNTRVKLKHEVTILADRTINSDNIAPKIVENEYQLQIVPKSDNGIPFLQFSEDKMKLLTLESNKSAGNESQQVIELKHSQRTGHESILEGLMVDTAVIMNCVLLKDNENEPQESSEFADGKNDPLVDLHMFKTTADTKLLLRDVASPISKVTETVCNNEFYNLSAPATAENTVLNNYCDELMSIKTVNEKKGVSNIDSSVTTSPLSVNVTPLITAEEEIEVTQFKQVDILSSPKSIAGNTITLANESPKAVEATENMLVNVTASLKVSDEDTAISQFTRISSPDLIMSHNSTILPKVETSVSDLSSIYSMEKTIFSGASSVRNSQESQLRSGPMPNISDGYTKNHLNISPLDHATLLTTPDIFLNAPQAITAGNNPGECYGESELSCLVNSPFNVLFNKTEDMLENMLTSELVPKKLMTVEESPLLENSMNKTHVISDLENNTPILNVTAEINGASTIVMNQTTPQLLQVSNEIDSNLNVSQVLEVDTQNVKNQNGIILSDNNKNKKMATGVLLEIHDNVLDNTMGGLLSKQQNLETSTKIDYTQNVSRNENFSNYGSFDIFNTEFKPSTGVVSRESLYIKFDPFYEPRNPLKKDKTIFVQELAGSDEQKHTPGLNETQMSSLSCQTQQEILLTEIERLKTIYNQRDQEAQVKEAELKRQTSEMERKCEEVRTLLEKKETEQKNTQNYLAVLSSTNKQLMALSLAYNRTAIIVRKQNSHKHQTNQASLDAMVAERDSCLEHLKNAEAAYVDVFAKFDKLCGILHDLKTSNADIESEAAELKRSEMKLDERISEIEPSLKADLENLNRTKNLEAEKFASNLARLTAQIRKAELYMKNAVESHNKIQRENEKIASLCDDILAEKP